MTARRYTLAVLAVLAALGGDLALCGAQALATPYSSVGSLGVEAPQAVAVEKATGDLFVTEPGAGKVLKLSPEGAVLGEINGAETPQQKLGLDFRGIAVDNSSGPSKGDVYIVSRAEGAVSEERPVVDKFQSKAGKEDEYEYVCELTGIGGGCHKETEKEGVIPTNEFGGFGALGVAVGASGDLYVTDYEAGSALLYEFGPAGEDITSSPIEPPVTVPIGIAVDAAGDIYVAGVSPGLNGEELAEVNAKGESSVLDKAGSAGVAVDQASGEVFVLDSKNEEGEEGYYHVTRYDATGKEIEQFGLNEFSQTIGIAYSAFNGDIYVADESTNQVLVFSDEVFKLPVVKIEPPGEPTPEGVTLNGSVNPEGEAGTNWYYAWGETESYGSRTPVEGVPAGAAPVPVSAALGRLLPNTLYHYQLFAANTHDKGKPAGSGDQEVMTKPRPPVVEGEPAQFLAAHAATLVAKVDPERSTTTYKFEYGTSESYGQETETAEAGAGLAAGFVSQRVEGLTPGAAYHFRVVATNAQGMSERGPDETFTTVAENPPVVLTGAASGVTQTGATLAGTVDPEGYVTSYVFEIGTSTAYGTDISGTLPGEDAEAQSVTFALADLVPLSTYHYRLLATNTNGTVYGQDETFTTPGNAYSLLLPPTPPLLSVPAIAFPTETATTTSTARGLTKAQRLAKALKGCAKRPKKQRASCERQARKRYGPVKRK